MGSDDVDVDADADSSSTQGPGPLGGESSVMQGGKGKFGLDLQFVSIPEAEAYRSLLPGLI